MIPAAGSGAFIQAPNSPAALPSGQRTIAEIQRKYSIGSLRFCLRVPCPAPARRARRLRSATGERPRYSARLFSRTGSPDSAFFSTRRSGKYALITYCSSIRCVLKNDPFSAIVERITRRHCPWSL